MVRVAKLQPRYGLEKKVFIRPNMRLQEDCLNIIRAIRKSEEDIKNGRVIPAEEVFKELREKYEY